MFFAWISKKELSPRLFALYRYLHAPTRQQTHLLSLLEEHLPLLGVQKRLRANPPRLVSEVNEWFRQALQARMTMEQILSATGMAPGQRKALLTLPAPTDQAASAEEAKSGAEQPSDPDKLARLQQHELEQLAIRAELWKALASSHAKAMGHSITC